jgi:hypothetical protein
VPEIAADRRDITTKMQEVILYGKSFTKAEKITE